jgi:hypothetical protein
MYFIMLLAEAQSSPSAWASRVHPIRKVHACGRPTLIRNNYKNIFIREGAIHLLPYRVEGRGFPSRPLKPTEECVIQAYKRLMAVVTLIAYLEVKKVDPCFGGFILRSPARTGLWPAV